MSSMPRAAWTPTSGSWIAPCESCSVMWVRWSKGLARGWPIASGPVEGACKNLIKDRMERSGMRWTEQMAEAIVQLRAIYLSGDFDCYWQFHIEQDQRRLYPVAWSVVAK